jgi:hypothetical protein
MAPRSTDKKAKKLAGAFALPSAEPKRSRVSEPAARKFVAAGEAPRRPKKAEREAKTERLFLYLPPDLDQAFRVRCAMDRIKLSDAAVEAIGEWVKRRGKGSAAEPA